MDVNSTRSDGGLSMKLLWDGAMGVFDPSYQPPSSYTNRRLATTTRRLATAATLI